MQTEISLLPVYNKLYDLGMTEESIERITKKVEKLDDTEFVYNFIANSTLVRLFSSTGRWRGMNVELFPYDVENKMVNGGTKFINDVLVKNVPSYTLDSRSVAVFKDLNPLALDAGERDLLLAGLAIVGGETTIINDVETIKKNVRDRLTNTYFSVDYLRYDIPSSCEVTPIEVVEWAFGVDLTNAKGNSSVRSNEDFIYQFTDISEKKNLRVAVAKRVLNNHSYYRSGHDSENVILIADPDQPCYDYLDLGRQFYSNSSDIPYRSFRSKLKTLSQFPKLYMLDENVVPSTNEEVFNDILNRHTHEETVLVDNLTMESVVRRFQRKEQKQNLKVVQADKLADKFKSRLEALAGTEGTVNLNGVALGNHSFEYEGQKLSCDQIYIPSLLTSYNRHRDLDNLNFDTLSGDFFRKLTRTIKESSEALELTGSIGDVKFKIENRVKTTTTGNVVKLAYMNECKIRKDEIGEIIERGLCFAEQTAFDSFVKQVSACSLKLHKYLNEGIRLHVRDDYKMKNIDFKIPLLRKSGKNYIVLDGKEYGVADSNRLIRLEGASYMHEAINTLLNPKVVRLDGPDDIAHIITKGEALHDADKDKNKNSINRVEELFDIAVTKIVNNGTAQRGYVIDGKMSKYFLDIGKTDKETVFDRLRVFSYPDMAYVCMIDKGIDQTGPGHLINRIYALHNDSMVAADVATLNQKK